MPGHRWSDSSRSSQKHQHGRFRDISTLCGSVYWGFRVIIYTLTQPIQFLWANEDAIVVESRELIPSLLMTRFGICSQTWLNNILDSEEKVAEQPRTSRGLRDCSADDHVKGWSLQSAPWFLFQRFNFSTFVWIWQVQKGSECFLKGWRRVRRWLNSLLRPDVAQISGNNLFDKHIQGSSKQQMCS